MFFLFRQSSNVLIFIIFLLLIFQEIDITIKSEYDMSEESLPDYEEVAKNRKDEVSI